MTRPQYIAMVTAAWLTASALLTFAAATPARAVQVCSADCVSEVSVDVRSNPCTYTWADAKFEVPRGVPSPGNTLLLRWKLKGPASAYWTYDGVFLSRPINLPEEDLNQNAVKGEYYQWEVAHLGSMPKKFTIDMRIYNGAQRCVKAAKQGDYEIDLK
jgi:hypothetical protein